MKTILKNTLKLSSLVIVAYLLYSNVSAFNTIWLGFSSSTKEIISSAVLYSLLTIFFSILGCNYQLTRNSLKSSIDLRINKIEEIIELTQSKISEFEERIVSKGNNTESRTTEKLAPAKQILSSMEKRLRYINVAKHLISLKKLNIILAKELDLHTSPTNTVLAGEYCSTLPKKLNLVDCTFVLKDIFNEVKSDLDFIENSAREKSYYRFATKGQSLRIV